MDNFVLRRASHAAYGVYMSLAEIKASIARMSREERLEVAALIAHLNRAEDLAYQAELDRRMAAMDSGHKSDVAALKKVHDDLASKGR